MLQMILANPIVSIVLGVVLLVVAFFLRHILAAMFGLYRIVPVNEAHIRILSNTKKNFSSRDGRSAYWYIPFITRLHKLPLTNLAIPVNDIKLNDQNMAKFVCDIMCFVNIKNVDLAVERLSLTHVTSHMGFDFAKLSEDLRAIMESIGRTVTTKQGILDIYMNRQMLDTAITKEVEQVFPKWGIELVDLELKDIKDAVGSTIIADIERKSAAVIRRDADIAVSESQRQSAVAVAENTKQSEVAKAASEETYRKRQVEKDMNVGVAEQEMVKLIAQKEVEANVIKVEAARKLQVGQADIERQKIEQMSEAQKIKYTVEAAGESNKIMSVGQAEADVMRIKKEAEAAGTLKLAEALKAFDQTAISVKMMDVQKEIMLAKFHALGQAVEKADIKWIMSGSNAQKFFGMNLDAEGGANLGQFLEESGLDLAKIKEAISGVVPVPGIKGK